LTKKERNREKQRRLRERQKEQGLVAIRIMVPREHAELARQCYDHAYNGGNTFEEFKALAFIRGVVFVGNTGKGRRIKKTEKGYELTKEN